MPATFVVQGNFIRSDQEARDDVLTLAAENPRGGVRFRVVGNRMSGHGNPASNSGVRLSMSGRGSVRADLYNNAIWDVARCRCADASGLTIVRQNTIRADVNLVGSTIELSQANALRVRNGVAPGGRLALDVFNNIFSHARSGAIRLEGAAASTFAFRAGYNNYYANAGPNRLAGWSAGPHNLNRDPHFTDRSAGNLRIELSSPMIDRGITCSPAGIATPDAGDHTRLGEAGVDIGAYEQRAGRSDGVIRLGNNGANRFVGTRGTDVLCGYGGNDVLIGRGQDDWLDGGDGNDRLIGGEGPDLLLGRNGNDVLCSVDREYGNDRLNGGPGRDAFRADVRDPRSSVERRARC
jgi:Ca2+-binding RTX toxin-like protein